MITPFSRLWSPRWAFATLPSLFLFFTAPVTQGTEDRNVSSASLRLIPFPKEVSLESGSCSLAQGLTIEAPAGETEVLTRLLNDELRQAGLRELAVRRVGGAPGTFRVAQGAGPISPPPVPEPGGNEAYALEIRTNGVICAARDPAGLVHGCQTLCQLIRANRQGDKLPCLRIRDWPSLRWRCFQDDLTRGPSSKLETLLYEAALGSYLKLNLMTYYMEYQFAFRKHPRIGPPDGSLTPAELSALVAQAKPMHLAILGNQQSFGHFGRILGLPEYAHLRETPDVLTPSREETYALLDDLYSEVCPVLPFPWFNVCCDETEGLGTGPTRELAGQIGIGGVYVRHLRRLHDLLQTKYQKRMMMWGDIILQHPDHLAELPKDTIMLSWGYDARADFESQITPFAKSGYEFFVCPGLSDWSRILPDFGVAVTNIQNFVRDGAKHGALGMINTDWEDDGEALKAVKWHGDAWAAECAWNASTTAYAAFQRRVGGVLFGESGDHFGQAVTLLTQTHRLPGMKNMFNARFWEKDFVPKGSSSAVGSVASNLLAVARPAIDHLQACRRDARCNQHILDVFLFGAKRMELIGQRMLDGLAAAQSYQRAAAPSGDLGELDRVEVIIRRNHDIHEDLGRQFARLWLTESKPYALDWTLTRYTNAVKDFESLLARLETAKAGGRPLPSPEEIGLPQPPPRF